MSKKTAPQKVCSKCKTLNPTGRKTCSKCGGDKFDVKPKKSLKLNTVPTGEAAAALYCLRLGSIDAAQKQLRKISADPTLDFIVLCGGVDKAIAMIEHLENSLISLKK